MNNVISSLRGIPIKSSSIEIIYEPKQFYETLCRLASDAKKRITLSTLYLGTGKLEKQLINQISGNKNFCDNKLKVNFLCDYLRGTRGHPTNSVSILKDLHSKGNIYLYHTPDLRGITKKILPERVNEIVGLQHMKFYVFDDDIIISGANLSHDYFTNRQDRYILIKNCPQLAEYFTDLIEAVGTCSFKVQSDGKLKLDDNCLIHPFEGNRNDFISMFTSRIKTIQNKLEILGELSSHNTNTSIYPLLNMGTYRIHEENNFLVNLFSKQESGSQITIASGYFNLTEQYINLITNNKNRLVNIITASPQANGFYTARGLSSNIPSLYVHVSKEFYEKNGENVKIYEYLKPNWTFHGKGIWYNDKSDKMLTIVGSSNFGERSCKRDLEAQLLLVTSDEELKRKLDDEKDSLIKNCKLVTSKTFFEPDHIVPLWISTMLTWMAARQASLEALSRQQGVVQNNYRNNIYRGERNAAMLRKKKGAGDTVLNFRKQNSPKKQNPYEKSEILNRIGGTCIRKIHTTSKMNKKEISNLKEMVDDLNFTPVYRFNGIWVGAFLAKAKLAQTVVSLFLIPYATYKLYIGTYNFENFMIVTLIGILAPILLFAFARFYSRIIGVISMSECNEYIRVGYLSFFGTRQNRYIKVDDVVPLNETTSTKSKHMIVPLYQNSRKDYLYLATKGVEIVDEERASKLFGGLKIFNADKKIN